MTKLYDRDFFAWTQDQADALRRRSANEIDWENLLEEVESLGRQEQGELTSHMTVLLTHLLKWQHQPARRSRSWMLTVLEQREQIRRLLRDNPSLKPRLATVLEDAFRVARLRAAKEMRVSLKALPAENPYSWDQAMTLEVEVGG